MKIFAEPVKAAERLEELISLAQRDDEVIICREGEPIAVLKVVRADFDRSSNRLWALGSNAGRNEAFLFVADARKTVDLCQDCHCASDQQDVQTPLLAACRRAMTLSSRQFHKATLDLFKQRRR